MFKKILTICIALVFASGCSTKKNDDNSALLLLLAASQQNANPLIGKWSLSSTSMRLSRGTNIGASISGIFTETYTGDTITGENNGVLTLSSNGSIVDTQTVNCTTTASYKKTSTTITYTVNLSTCSGTPVGKTTTHNYTINGNNMTQTGNEFDANLGSYSWSSSYVKQ